MSAMRASLVLFLCGCLCLTPGPAAAQLAGHGGPVRALAISADGGTLVSGSFDTAAIRWSLATGAASQVFRFHDGAVNAVALLPDGRIVTAGEDTRVALWTPGRQAPDAVLLGHEGPVSAIAVSPDGASIATASWDRTVRLWSLSDGKVRVFRGHQQNVNAVAFTPDGTTLVTAGYDAAVRFWPIDEAEAGRIAMLPSPLNTVVVAGDGEIAAAGADGRIYFLSPDGEERGNLETSSTPITALAQARSGEQLAAATIGGSIVIIDRRRRVLVRTLDGRPHPVWALALSPDAKTVLSGGADRLIRSWDLESGQLLGGAGDGARDPLAAYADDPGARVFRACIACHALKPEDGNRAGPTLHGIFGRRIATLPGYNFSEALKHLDIVWTPETVAKLFELGPSRFTPGTKMPEQRITVPEDRATLIKFLERATN
jgi:cytochrome c